MKYSEILRLCKKHGLKISGVQEAKNSYNSNVYIINDKDTKYVLKINNNYRKRINEKKYYSYLSNYIYTANVLYSGIYNNYNYNIISYLDGKNIYDEDCNSLTEKEILNIGKLLGKIHSCAIIDKSSVSWNEYLKKSLEMSFAALNDVLEKKDNEDIYKFLNNYIRKNIVNNYKDCLLHMDYRIGNIIIDKNLEPGIIDLESMRNGDYIFDFVKINRNFNKKNFNIFLKGYKSERCTEKLDESFFDKLKFYSFFDSYTSLYWCCLNQKISSNFYKLNYKIIMKILGEIRNGKWIV